MCPSGSKYDANKPKSEPRGATQDKAADQVKSQSIQLCLYSLECHQKLLKKQFQWSAADRL